MALRKFLHTGIEHANTEMIIRSTPGELAPVVDVDKLRDGNAKVLVAVAALPCDCETDAHNFRVTVYSVCMAEAMGLDSKSIRSLIKGAFLHDVGKAGIPDAILSKPGSLSEAERMVMQDHVRYGLEIVGNTSCLADAAGIVGCHHEKFDGSGYPNRLAGDAIPLAARIFAIVDVFDALTSVRPYKQAFAIGDSLEMLRQGGGTHFDPELIAIFEPLAPALLARVAVPREELPRLLETAVMPYFNFASRETIS